MKPILFLALTICLVSCTSTKHNQYQLTKNYKPDNQQLYDTIVKLDSLFFDAYNNCNEKLEFYASFYADSLEFYHDNGGLMNSKKDVVEGTKKHICGKVTRELVRGSIEVYPIKNFGAIEMGLHIFHNNQEPGHELKVGRFMLIWEQTKTGWKIKKVVSLH